MLLIGVMIGVVFALAVEHWWRRRKLTQLVRQYREEYERREQLIGYDDEPEP